MSHPQRASSTDSTADAIRKRVCKACDRCRLKKSKCDGSNPCSRCKADNAICVFGERKKSHDKVYPKGYVEMLEQQQSQLVSGLQELYRRLLAGHSWTGKALSETNGNPLTHDLLAALGLLEAKHDGNGEMETFEEDCEKLQSRLIADGAGYVRRRGSFSSESDHSQHVPGRSTTQSTPTTNKPPFFKENFSFSASPSPITRSPMPRHRQSYPPAQESPLHQSSPMTNDPQLFQSDWTIPNDRNAEAITRSGFAMGGPQLQPDLEDVNDLLGSGLWDESPYDFSTTDMITYPHMASAFDALTGTLPGGVPTYIDPHELDYRRFLQVR